MKSSSWNRALFSGLVIFNKANIPTFALVDDGTGTVVSSSFDEGNNHHLHKVLRGNASFQRLAAESDHDHDHDHDHSGEAHSDDEYQSGKPWGAVLGTTLLINLATLSGIIFFVPAFSRSMKHKIMSAICWNADEELHAHQHECDGEVSQRHSKTLDIFLPSFASGALLSTVFFLVLPESISLLNNAMMESAESVESVESDTHEDHDEHGTEIDTGAVWRMGIGVLGGFVLPILIGALFPRAVEHECDSTCGPAGKSEIDPVGKCILKPENCAACDEEGHVISEKNVGETSALSSRSELETNKDEESKISAAENPNEEIENEISHEHSHEHSHDHGHSHEHGKLSPS